MIEQPNDDPHGECGVLKLLALLIECRSSVKFDLLHYEKMARAYRSIGPEGEQKYVMAEAEAQRLHGLMEKIDALALGRPNELGQANGVTTINEGDGACSVSPAPEG